MSDRVKHCGHIICDCGPEPLNLFNIKHVCQYQFCSGNPCGPVDLKSLLENSTSGNRPW